MTFCLAIPQYLAGFCSVSWPSALCCLPSPELYPVGAATACAKKLVFPLQLIFPCSWLFHLQLVFPLGSPLHAKAAHQKVVGMAIVFSIQRIKLEEGKADKER